MGLSRELLTLDAGNHVAILASVLERYPNAMLDISWRIIQDHVFADPAQRAVYVDFLNAYSERILPGTDFVASANRDFEDYRSDLLATSRILRYVDDTAFRNIALGRNYFRLLNLDYEAPPVCGAGDDGG